MDSAQVSPTTTDTWPMMMTRLSTIGLVVVALSLLAAGCSGEVLTLEVGTCFDDPESYEQVTNVPEVDCADPHDNEVIGLRQLSGSSFPGDDAVGELADNLCVSVFEDYVGTSYLESAYEFGWLVPTSGSWNAGDREVICFAYDPTFAKITGSLQGRAA